MRYSTHRLLQVSCLFDDLSSKARLASGASKKARANGRSAQSSYFAAKAMRIERIAFKAASMLEKFS